MKISEKLSLLRVKLGLSYGRLGQLANISPSTYLQWEQGIEPTKLKLLPVLELFSDLFGREITEANMRNEKLDLKFDKSGKPIFAPGVVEETTQMSGKKAELSASPETILEYEGIYSRLRVSNKLTEKEAQMLLYLVKGFIADEEEI